MKNNIITYRARQCLLLIIITLLGTAGMNKALAQPTLNPASNTDNPAGGSYSLSHGINSAVMDYSYNCGNVSCAATSQQLEAMVIANEGLWIYDQLLTKYNAFIPAGTRLTPAVAIANVGSSSAYIVGVVYSRPSIGTCGTGYDIFLDIYNVANAGNLFFACTYSATYPITPANVLPFFTPILILLLSTAI